MNKLFWISVGKRALWTFCEGLLAALPVGAGLEEVRWFHVLSVAALAAIVSALKSIVVGMPEVNNTEGASE